MAETMASRRWRVGGSGRVVAAVLAVATLAVVGAFAAGASGAAILLVLGGALLGAALAWAEARRAQRTAEKASAELASLANRLLELEFRLARQDAGASETALHSSGQSVAEESGAPGGPVRVLDPAPAASVRSAAELRERVPVRAPSPAPDHDPSGDQPAFPAPYLLPTVRRGSSRTTQGTATSGENGNAAARAAATAEGNAGGPPALQSREPPDGEADAQRRSAIVEALDADRIELHLQPVVALPEREVRLYEALARLRLADETVLLPHEFLPLLESLKLAGEFDRRILLRAFSIARHLMARGSEAMLSVNLSPQAGAEPEFLRSLASLFDDSSGTAGRVVLEFPQRGWRTLDADGVAALAALRARGVSFTLDRVTDLRLDPLGLAEGGVRFVKIPVDLLLASDRSTGPGAIDLSAALRAAGLALVAERVEHEAAVPSLLDLGVPLAQGFVFAPPRAVRAEVLGASSARNTSLPASPTQAAREEDPPSRSERRPGG